MPFDSKYGFEMFGVHSADTFVHFGTKRAEKLFN